MPTKIASAEELDPDRLRSRIKWVLGIYPKISPTMMQVGIGTAIPSKNWKPVLDDMVEKGEVLQLERSGYTPEGRYHSYKVLMLPNAMQDQQHNGGSVR